MDKSVTEEQLDGDMEEDLPSHEILRENLKRRTRGKLVKTYNETDNGMDEEPMEDFSSHEILRENLKKKTRGKRVETYKDPDTTHECHICGKICTNKANLLSHLPSHSSNRPYSCSLCPYKGKTKKYVSRHTKLMHRGGLRCSFSCDFCGKLFYSRDKMECHERIHTGEKPYVCEVCGKAFRVQYSWQTHMYIHTDEKPYKCEFCEYACRDNSTLRKHRARHMGTNKAYQCELCPKLFDSPSQVRQHMQEKHIAPDVRKFPCDRCDSKFHKPWHLRNHVETVHLQTKKCTCPVCGVTIKSHNNLKTHMRYHMDTRPYKCSFDSCTSSFKNKYDLKKHSVIHDMSKHVICDICGRTFSRKSRLAKHIGHHKVRVKSEVCQLCGDKFYTKQYLQKHMIQKHAKNRQKYACDMCDFSTHNKPSIVMHIKCRHMREKNKCQICDKAYKRNVHLRIHYWNTHQMRFKTYARMHVPPDTSVRIKQEPPDLVPDMEFDLLDVDKDESSEDSTEIKLESKSGLEPTEYELNSTEGRPKQQTLEQFLRQVIHGTEEHQVVFSGLSDQFPFDPTKDADQKEKTEGSQMTSLEVGNDQRKSDDKNKTQRSVVKTNGNNQNVIESTSDLKLKALSIKLTRLDAFSNTEHNQEPEKEIGDRISTEKQQNIQKLTSKEPTEETLGTCVIKQEKCTNSDDEYEPYTVTSNYGEICTTVEVTRVDSEEQNLQDEEQRKDEDNRNDKKQQEIEETVKESAPTEIGVQQSANEVPNNVVDIGNTETILGNDEVQNITKGSKEAMQSPETSLEVNEIANFVHELTDGTIEKESTITEVNSQHNATEPEANTEIIKNIKEEINPEPMLEENKETEDIQNENEEIIQRNDKPVEEDAQSVKIDDKEKTQDEIMTVDKSAISDVEQKLRQILVKMKRMDCGKPGVLRTKERRLKVFTDEEIDKIRRSNKRTRRTKKVEAIDEGNSQNNDKSEGEKESDEEKPKDKVPESLKELWNMHQCYICFKLFETKPKLLDHCKEHFDVCTENTLKKCPLCAYVTTKSDIRRHLRKKHHEDVNISFMKIMDRKENASGSRYYYDTKNENIKELEIIPSIKILNKKASMEIDRKRRKRNDTLIGTRKLVRKGDEWIVEKEKIDLSDFVLPDSKDLDKNSENYLEVIKKLGKEAKRKGVKMLYPCNKCEKVCQNLSALTLHGRRHDPNPKPFRPRGFKTNTETKDTPVNNNRNADPKPIVSNHNCDPKLMDFYEKNIKGGDIEFWQFLKIYNKLNKNKVNSFKDLEATSEFRMHVVKNVPDPEIISIIGNPVLQKRVSKCKKIEVPAGMNKRYIRTIRISKIEYNKRQAIKNKMRENLSSKDSQS